ncbi:hypothetical protein HRJ34_25930 [Rhizorhabdus wittichii]|uniref:Gluconolactonase n=1 Tax=Rhizorhabdus wittichii TaxID=160791 RepID=A0A975D2Y2_9SPHN|nr:L-dopachrome tautomerase-related protein [Rhizorhabdus wittichii]QTH21698.1 hypothetical protein HRJ34_25930 [Rhizorhabdus wittichii]
MPSRFRAATCLLAITVPIIAASAPIHVPVAPALETVKAFEDFKLIGIAVSRDGRIFASAPAATVGDRVIEVDARTSAVQSYPDETWRKPDADGRDPWFAPQALWIDDADDLWVLDSGRPTLPTSAPTGAPKLVRFDLGSNKAVRTYRFDGVVAPDDSLNDVRIDHRRGKAYLANVGRQGSLVILDLASGTSRQVLVGDRSTQADTSEPFLLGNEPAIPKGGQPMVVHADGLTLSPDAEWLYYRTLTDHNYWRIRTADLANDRLSDHQLAERTEFLGRGPVTGGIIMDAAGTLYGGDLEHGSIVALTVDPVSGRLRSRIFIEAPGKLVWPDGFAIAGGYLYVADARLSETVFENSLPRRGVPTIFRIKLPTGSKTR